jgi:CP family cyanate transporter-like MFS transporter
MSHYQQGNRAVPAVASVTAVSAILVFAVSLRLVFGSNSALQQDLADAYGLGPVLLALLTTGPVVCFGLFGAAAGRLTARWGATAVAVAALLLVAVGSAVRGLPAWQAVFLGTLVAGAGVAVGNVLGPVLIRIHTPQWSGVMTGLYTALVSAGAGIASGLTVPVRDALGGLHPALALWAVPPVIGVLLLLLPAVATGRPGPSGERRPPVPLTAFRGDRRVLALTVFMGLQSLVAYSMIGWLPSVFRQRGMDATRAGVVLTVLSLVSIVTALIVPVLAARMHDQRAVAVGLSALTTVGLLGVALGGTRGAMVWAVLLGLGQGGELSLVMALVNIRTRTVADAAALSTVTQSVGYLIAACGPLTVGLVHSLTGGWTVPVLVLVVLSVLMGGAGLVAGRPGVISGDPAPAPDPAAAPDRPAAPGRSPGSPPGPSLPPR